jgi:hypothetical protein
MLIATGGWPGRQGGMRTPLVLGWPSASIGPAAVGGGYLGPLPLVDLLGQFDDGSDDGTHRRRPMRGRQPAFVSPGPPPRVGAWVAAFLPTNSSRSASRAAKVPTGCGGGEKPLAVQNTGSITLARRPSRRTPSPRPCPVRRHHREESADTNGEATRARPSQPRGGLAIPRTRSPAVAL